MTTLAQVLRFEPEKLRDAALKVVVLHPNTARSLPGVEGDRLDDVIRRLLACGADEESLRAFGAGVTAREHRGLLAALVRLDADLSDRIAAALAPHLKPYSVSVLWRVWQKVPHDRPTLILLRKGATDFGMSEATVPEWTDVAEQWVTGDPLVEIASWAANEGVRIGELPRLSRSPFAADMPVIDQLWRQVLMHGSANQLQSEDADEVSKRGFGLAPDDVQRFGSNYLMKLPRSRWRRAVLEGLRARYGLPEAEGARPAFWKRVAEDQQRAFRTYFLKRELKKAFGGDSDRHHFWERWVGEMRDLTTGHAGATQYAIIEFSNFGVVEFFEVGNAAYFYDKTTINRIRRIKPSAPSDLKSGSDRLIHSAGWESQGDIIVQRRLRRR